MGGPFLLLERQQMPIHVVEILAAGGGRRPGARSLIPILALTRL
jgi:hypothetical protein